MEEMKHRLKQLRKILKLKQREVAERLEINVGTYGAWETGSESIPRARLYQLCNEYNVRREWLTEGTGEMFEPEREPVDERDAQRRFVLRCFRALPAESQELLLEALREYVDETTPEPEQEKTPPQDVGAVLVAFNDTGGRDDEATA